VFVGLASSNIQPLFPETALEAGGKGAPPANHQRHTNGKRKKRRRKKKRKAISSFRTSLFPPQLSTPTVAPFCLTCELKLKGFLEGLFEICGGLNEPIFVSSPFLILAGTSSSSSA